MADRFGCRRAARFSRLEYAITCLGQHLGEVADLGAFPAAFDPLQGNEETASLPFFYAH